ncbi:transposase [Marinifilum flexuosum]|uniref:transposase n=1 Tax=Marinifilum flexuosum TaxID=1117708 RepID=UPI00248FD18A|nr:transposase [Marinifilum flexuosum]
MKTNKFQNKYRIPSARATWWDYSSEGLYFITICTQHKETLFGEIESEQMILSPIGKIVEEEWLKSFSIRDELYCEEYVIMPNHIHAILQIKNNPVETHGRASTPNNNGVAYRPPKSISSFVAGFKSAASTKINQYRQSKVPVWQTRFHDRIIHDFEEYHRIQNYIIDNPRNWKKDKLYIG